MNNDAFIARVASGIAATAMVGATILPRNQTSEMECQMPPQELALATHALLPKVSTQSGKEGTAKLLMRQNPSEWTKSLEREFRALALKEAKGDISQEQTTRLEELNQLRNHLVQGPTVDEILLQLKKERLLARMESLLKEYVEFKETEGNKRVAA